MASAAAAAASADILPLPDVHPKPLIIALVGATGVGKNYFGGLIAEFCRAFGRSAMRINLTDSTKLAAMRQRCGPKYEWMFENNTPGAADSGEKKEKVSRAAYYAEKVRSKVARKCGAEARAQELLNAIRLHHSRGNADVFVVSDIQLIVDAAVLKSAGAAIVLINAPKRNDARLNFDASGGAKKREELARLAIEKEPKSDKMLEHCSKCISNDPEHSWTSERTLLTFVLEEMQARFGPCTSFASDEGVSVQDAMDCLIVKHRNSAPVLPAMEREETGEETMQRWLDEMIAACKASCKRCSSDTGPRKRVARSSGDDDSSDTIGPGPI